MQLQIRALYGIKIYYYFFLFFIFFFIVFLFFLLFFFFFFLFFSTRLELTFAPELLQAHRFAGRRPAAAAARNKTFGLKVAAYDGRVVQLLKKSGVSL